MFGHDEALRAMLEASAGASELAAVPDRAGHTALEHACYRGLDSIVSVLAEELEDDAALLAQRKLVLDSGMAPASGQAVPPLQIEKLSGESTRLRELAERVMLASGNMGVGGESF